MSYVYEIVVDGIVRYIGKGTGNRAKNHIAIANGVNRQRDAGKIVKTQKFYNRLAKALRAGSTVSYRIVVDDLSAEQAYLAEIAAIVAAPDDQLWNELPGGQGADSNHFKRLWASPEGRAKYLEIFNDPEIVARKKMKAAIQWSDQAARERNRIKVSTQWADSEFREARVQRMRDAYTPELKRKRSEAAKRRWADPSFRAATATAIKKALAKKGGQSC